MRADAGDGGRRNCRSGPHATTKRLATTRYRMAENILVLRAGKRRAANLPIAFNLKRRRKNNGQIHSGRLGPRRDPASNVSRKYLDLTGEHVDYTRKQLDHWRRHDDFAGRFVAADEQFGPEHAGTTVRETRPRTLNRYRKRNWSESPNQWQYGRRTRADRLAGPWRNY